ncbi:hypothetical protein LJC32_00040 [Oscillospiraceae bacterium OttesenSCG-928-F05]|nr:hypothetical protein [Oscillospiraceae bacterium OttesenSCG-928-F05]
MKHHSIRRVLAFFLVLALFTGGLPAVASAAEDAPRIGSETDFYCLATSDGEMTLETFTLAAESEYAYVYVIQDPRISADDKFLPRGSSPNALSQRIADEFDKMYALISTPGVDTFFGEPYDIDGDGKVTILLMDIFGDNGKSAGGYTAGVFHRLNFTYYNHADIVYIDIANTQGYAALERSFTNFCTTLIHEYTHLLSFSAFYTARGSGGAMLETWLDEGLAELASILYSGAVDLSMVEPVLNYKFLPGTTMVPTDAQWAQADAHSDFDYIISLYGSAGLAMLSYYQGGASISDLLSDMTHRSYAPQGSHALVGSHYAGDYKSGFDVFFTDYMLNLFVGDMSGKNPGFSSVKFDAWKSLNRKFSTIKEGAEKRFLADKSPFMPAYTGRATIADRIGSGRTAINVTVTDNTAYAAGVSPTRYYVVYPSSGSNTDVHTASSRSYMEVKPGRLTTVPVGENNSFAFITVTYNTNQTSASASYTAIKAGQMGSDGLTVLPPIDLFVDMTADAA